VAPRSICRPGKRVESFLDFLESRFGSCEEEESKTGRYVQKMNFHCGRGQIVDRGAENERGNSSEVAEMRTRTLALGNEELS
jgi:hypothetical protein